MDDSTFKWIEKQIKNLGPFNNVVEFGSLDVNGSVRPLFKADPNVSYIGIDYIPGKNVDLVENVHRLSLPDQCSDCVIATSFFEHDNKFWISLMQAHRILKPQGWFIVTVPCNGFPVHWERDYFRFTQQAMREVIMEQFYNINIDDPIEAIDFPSMGAVGQKGQQNGKSSCSRIWRWLNQ